MQHGQFLLMDPSESERRLLDLNFALICSLLENVADLYIDDCLASVLVIIYTFPMYSEDECANGRDNNEVLKWDYHAYVKRAKRRLDSIINES